MTFECPECLTPGALEIRLSLALPADSRSDDIDLQIVACARCGFQGAAVYEESRRGTLDSEAWEHTGYRLAEEDLRALSETIQQCPRPSESGCACPSHYRLGRAGAGGRWQELAGIQVRGSFQMRLAARPRGAAAENTE